MASTNYTNALKSLKNSNFDLYLLQETHLPDLKQGEHWQKQWGAAALWSPGTNRSFGVGLLIKPGSSIEIVDHRPDSDGRVLCSKLSIGGNVLQIINVYAPNDHSVRADFFGNLWRYTFRNLDTLMAGDFNCIPDTKLDKWGGDDSFGDRGVAQVNSFVRAFSLDDVFHVKNPDTRLFTWFYTPWAWRSQLRDHNCQPFSYSDHHMVSFKLNFGLSRPKRRGVWKFNTKLLNSEAFCLAVNEFWPQWQADKLCFSDRRSWWDAGKLQLKEITISHSIQAAKNRKSERLDLEIEFHNLSSRGDPNSAFVRNRLSELKELMKAIYDEYTEGAIIRRKEQWIELGQKPTKYFYQLESSQQSRNAIFALQDADDKLINSHTGVLGELHNFYKSLFSAEPIDQASREWLLTQLDSSLTLEDQAQCEDELTVFECHEALSQMQSGKSPGSDGFPAEFYSRFWGLLGGDLVDSLNFSFREGSLSASQRRGILCLLYKKDDPLA